MNSQNSNTFFFKKKRKKRTICLILIAMMPCNIQQYPKERDSKTSRKCDQSFDQSDIQV